MLPRDEPKPPNPIYDAMKLRPKLRILSHEIVNRQRRIRFQTATQHKDKSRASGGSNPSATRTRSPMKRIMIPHQWFQVSALPCATPLHTSPLNTAYTLHIYLKLLISVASEFYLSLSPFVSHERCVYLSSPEAVSLSLSQSHLYAVYIYYFPRRYLSRLTCTLRVSLTDLRSLSLS